MKVELIPVIEITNYDEDIPMPPSGPYWEFPDEWEDYRISANIKAGFSKDLKPYFKSSSFYRISEISDKDLLKIIHKEIEIQQTEENRGIDDLTCSLDGGYILKINNVDKYFPHCCGKLRDITEWEDLIAEEEHVYFYMGHPSPRVEKSETKIIFDFLNSEIQDPYSPPILEGKIAVDKEVLKIAIENAKNELFHFAQQLIKINELENLNIPEIDTILIYGIDE
ncbi:hypothetical protein ACFP3I_15040 [Chryseobacterium arachidis]